MSGGGTNTTTTQQTLSPEAARAIAYITDRAQSISSAQDPSGMNDQMRRSNTDIQNYLGSDAYRQPNQNLANMGNSLLTAPAGNPFTDGRRSLTPNDGGGSAGGGMGGLLASGLGQFGRSLAMASGNRGQMGPQQLPQMMAQMAQMRSPSPQQPSPQNYNLQSLTPPAPPPAEPTTPAHNFTPSPATGDMTEAQFRAMMQRYMDMQRGQN